MTVHLSFNLPHRLHPHPCLHQMSSSRTTPTAKELAMETSLPHDLTNIALPTTPQQSLDRAEAMLQQAEGLRKEARALQSQIQGLNKRADTLTKSALTFQAVAARDRQSVQYTLEGGLVVFNELVATYKSLPHNATRLQTLQGRVEDGMATLQDLQDMFQDIQRFCKDTRVLRSPAPEPESPPETAPVPGSEKSNSHGKTHKRSFATMEEDYTEPSPASREVTTASIEVTASNLITAASREMADASEKMMTENKQLSPAREKTTTAAKESSKKKKKKKGSVPRMEAEESSQLEQRGTRGRNKPQSERNNKPEYNEKKLRKRKYRTEKSDRPIKQEADN
ncbi:hypothetical protein EDD37DRAFT_207956 [Exophiala viscosa]|uniref:uncharacterized protein n=1 Tax=Exophiala viscosa TaxID=2486360 RepID=UPI0021971917|nr:hypothetical protein EDD37DRAFT_207956 [Exophiala viscosa]